MGFKLRNECVVVLLFALPFRILMLVLVVVVEL